MSEIRIAKFIADAGVCSRREAERLILEGRVKVNGKLLDTPAFKVTSQDDVVVNGKKLEGRTETKLWLFHKPKEVITSTKDPRGRKTVFDILPEGLPRVITVGRLDYNTEGLLLLTNSGELARKYELPSTALERVYRCRVHGKLTQSIISKLKSGVTVQGIRYGEIGVTIEGQSSGTNSWVNVTLSEGKNREIRNAFEHFGLAVNRLIRTQYGPYSLGKLKKGEVREVEVKSL